MKIRRIQSAPLLESSGEIKIYHTETQDDFDALMIDLERKGYRWTAGWRPTEETSRWKKYSSETCIKVERGLIVYFEKSYSAVRYPGIPIIKYKAKADDPNQYKLVANEVKVYQIDLSSIRKDSAIRYREKGKEWIRGLVKSVDRDRIYISRTYRRADVFSAKSIGIGDVEIKVDDY